eukprot:scaffold123490_cov17-Tisochrysis_lutea.AAC.1
MPTVVHASAYRQTNLFQIRLLNVLNVCPTTRNDQHLGGRFQSKLYAVQAASLNLKTQETVDFTLTRACFDKWM